MDFIKDFIKKNVHIIIPSAIGFTALLVLVPTILVRAKVSDELSNSIGMGQNIDSALRSAVPQKQFEVEKRYQDAHEADANAIKALAVQSTQRSLLSYKIFPEPNDTSIQIFNEFGNAYKKVFAGYLKELSALDAPSDIEIRKEIGSTGVSSNRRGGGYAGGMGGGIGSRGSAAEQSGQSQIIDVICKRRSEEIPIYANPQVFGGGGFWDNWVYPGSAQAVSDCWYSQLACWIDNDVVDTIKTMNKGSRKVADSSVKRLLGISFDSQNAVFEPKPKSATDSTHQQAGAALPYYVSNSIPGLCSDWTGRVDNKALDIVHFSVAVVVSAQDVLKFMDELCSEKSHTFSGYKGDKPQKKFRHNQITILKSGIEPVDTQSPLHNRYRYGAGAVVTLNLVCQYMFYVEGYSPIKPESMKKKKQTPANTRQRNYRGR